MTARTAVAAYLVLLLLLALTVGSSLLPLGAGNTALNLAFAAGKATVIGAVFMHLRRSGILVSLACAALLLWLAMLGGMTLLDVLNRQATGTSARHPISSTDPRSGPSFRQSPAPASR